VEQLDAFFHRSLESFSAGDQSHTAGAFVNHRGANCPGKIVLPAAAAINGWLKVCLAHTLGTISTIDMGLFSN